MVFVEKSGLPLYPEQTERQEQQKPADMYFENNDPEAIENRGKPHTAKIMRKHRKTARNARR